MPDEKRVPLLDSSSSFSSPSSSPPSLSPDVSPPPLPSLSLSPTPSADTPTNRTQPASLHSYRLPSSSSLVPSTSYTVYQTPPPTFHTSHPRPPPLLLIPSTPAHSSLSTPLPHPIPPSSSSTPLPTPLTAIPISVDTILVRTPHRFTWSSLTHQYLFPATLPPHSSPLLSSYVSPHEWSTSISHLNAALRWPPLVQLLRLVLASLTLLLFAAAWSHEVRERRLWMFACWACVLAAGGGFVGVTRVWGERVRRRLEAEVEAENDYYEGRRVAGREGRDNRLPCSWRLDEQYLVVSAPAQAPLGHYGPLTVSRGQQHSPAHEYQHQAPWSSRQEPLHTPMEHF